MYRENLEHVIDVHRLSTPHSTNAYTFSFHQRPTTTPRFSPIHPCHNHHPSLFPAATSLASPTPPTSPNLRKGTVKPIRTISIFFLSQRPLPHLWFLRAFTLSIENFPALAIPVLPSLSHCADVVVAGQRLLVLVLGVGAFVKHGGSGGGWVARSP